MVSGTLARALPYYSFFGEIVDGEQGSGTERKCCVECRGYIVPLLVHLCSCLAFKSVGSLVPQSKDPLLGLLS